MDPTLMADAEVCALMLRGRDLYLTFLDYQTEACDVIFDLLLVFIELARIIIFNSSLEPLEKIVCLAVYFIGLPLAARRQYLDLEYDPTVYPYELYQELVQQGLEPVAHRVHL